METLVSHSPQAKLENLNKQEEKTKSSKKATAHSLRLEISGRRKLALYGSKWEIFLIGLIAAPAEYAACVKDGRRSAWSKCGAIIHMANSNANCLMSY